MRVPFQSKSFASLRVSQRFGNRLLVPLRQQNRLQSSKGASSSTKTSSDQPWMISAVGILTVGFYMLLKPPASFDPKTSHEKKINTEEIIKKIEKGAEKVKDAAPNDTKEAAKEAKNVKDKVASGLSQAKENIGDKVQEVKGDLAKNAVKTAVAYKATSLSKEASEFILEAKEFFDKNSDNPEAMKKFATEKANQVKEYLENNAGNADEIKKLVAEKAGQAKEYMENNGIDVDSVIKKATKFGGEAKEYVEKNIGDLGSTKELAEKISSLSKEAKEFMEKGGDPEAAKALASKIASISQEAKDYLEKNLGDVKSVKDEAVKKATSAGKDVAKKVGDAKEETVKKAASEGQNVSAKLSEAKEYLEEKTGKEFSGSMEQLNEFIANGNKDLDGYKDQLLSKGQELSGKLAEGTSYIAKQVSESKEAIPGQLSSLIDSTEEAATEVLDKVGGTLGYSKEAEQAKKIIGELSKVAHGKTGEATELIDKTAQFVAEKAGEINSNINEYKDGKPGKK